VLKAVQATLPDYMLTDRTAGCFAAAALRAAADLVAPEQLEGPIGSGFRWGGWAAKSGVRAELLAIAAELEAVQ
jgi:hypothetical protein